MIAKLWSFRIKYLTHACVTAQWCTINPCDQGFSRLTRLQHCFVQQNSSYTYGNASANGVSMRQKEHTEVGCPFPKKHFKSSFAILINEAYINKFNRAYSISA